MIHVIASKNLVVIIKLLNPKLIIVDSSMKNMANMNIAKTAKNLKFHFFYANFKRTCKEI